MRQLLFCLLPLLSACSPVARVTSVDQVAGTDFTVYHSYNFPETEGRNEQGYQIASPTLRVWQTAVAVELEKRGYQRASQPDVWVHVDVRLADKMQTRQTYAWEAPPYIGQRRYAWQSQDVPVRAYKEGTTTVGIVDAKRNALVWQGNVAGVVAKKQDQQAQQLQRSIQVLFARYPVPVL